MGLKGPLETGLKAKSPLNARAPHVTQIEFNPLIKRVLYFYNLQLQSTVAQAVMAPRSLRPCERQRSLVSEVANSYNQCWDPPRYHDTGWCYEPHVQESQTTEHAFTRHCLIAQLSNSCLRRCPGRSRTLSPRTGPPRGRETIYVYC